MLAVERSWAGDAGGVALVACVQSWAVVVVCGFRGRWWSFVRCCVVCVVLLSLLGGRGGCCCSWTAGFVSVSGLHVTLHRGDVVAKRTWVVVGRCVEVVVGVVGVVVVG